MPDPLTVLVDSLPDSRDQLIEELMPFAWSIAERKCFHRRDLDDAVSEAYCGLVEAVNKIAKGKLKHDNVLGFVALYVIGKVCKYFNSLGRYEPLRDDISLTVPSEIEANDLADQITVSAEEANTLTLLLEGYNDTEIGKKLDRSSVHVARLKQTIATRYTEVFSGELG